MKEIRHLSFKKGINRVQFSWSNTLIDPTSIRFALRTHSDQVELIDTAYPPNQKEVLIWNVRSEIDSRDEGTVSVQISYFTSGISWAANYAGFLETDGKTMDLKGYVTIINNSGEDYENASFRLIVGRINLVEKIADLARAGVTYRDLKTKDRALYAAQFRYYLGKTEEPGTEGEGKLKNAKKIVKEGLSEYFLYTIEGTDTVRTTWRKRMPSFSVAGLPVELFYRLDDSRRKGNVRKMLRFKNEKHVAKKEGDPTLGLDPLPNGTIQLFTRSADNTLWFEAAQSLPYLAIGQEVDVDLGIENRIIVDRKRMVYQKINNVHHGFRSQEFFTTVLKNRLAVPARLEVYRTFPGKFKIMKSSLPFKQDDHDTYFFQVSLKPDQTVRVTYQVDTKVGINTKNNEW